MFQGVRLGHARKRVKGAAAEGASGGGQDDLLNGVVELPGDALVNGAVFRIHGVDVHAFVARGVHHDFACDHEGLFVGEGDVLSGVDGAEGGLEACGADHGREDHVNAVDFDNLLERFRATVDLDAVVEQGVVDFLPLRVITNDDHVGLEFLGLGNEQFRVAMG